MNLWKWIRDSHLWTGAFGLAFLGVYALSSLQIVKPEWFHLRPAPPAESRLTLPPNLEPRPVAAQLRAQAGLKGDLNGIRATPALIQFRLAVAGRFTDVRYVPATGETTLKSTLVTTSQFLNRMHFTAGFWHDAPEMNWLGALAAAVSTALLVLGGTGLLLWYRMKSERRIGLLLTAVSFVWGFGLLVAIRYA